MFVCVEMDLSDTEVQLVIGDQHLKVKRDVQDGNKSFRMKEWW